MQDLNSDNISLIYEFNQDSPLFARVAAGEIAEKNYDQAKEILEDGIKNLPPFFKLVAGDWAYFTMAHRCQPRSMDTS